MDKSVLLVLVFTFSYFLYAETPDWSWAACSSGKGINTVSDVIIDQSGYSYITGTFKGSVGFGNTTLIGGNCRDFYIAKQNAGGSWVWAVQAGGTISGEVVSITTDNFGNCYITGWFSGTAQFGSNTITSSGNEDIFIAKLNSSAVWAWAISGGGISNDYVREITSDSEGNCYITGTFSQTVTIGTNCLTSSGPEDIFIAKINSMGLWQWAVRAGGTNSDDATSIVVDDYGMIYATGTFQGTGVFGATSLISSGNGTDIYVAKLNSDGLWQWAVRCGGTYEAEVISIDCDAIGNSCITGNFSYSITIGNITHHSSGESDLFIARLTPSGTWSWSIKGGGEYADRVSGVSVESNGNIYLTGNFDRVTHLGGLSLNSGQSQGGFMAKLNSSGGWQWAVTTTGGLYGMCNPISIAVDNTGYLRVCGSFMDSVTFGSTTLTNCGTSDIFISKLSTAGVWQWVRKCDGTSNTNFKSVASDSNGNSYVTGSFSGTVSFGSNTLTCLGYTDVFVAKINSSGIWVWAAQAGGSSNDGSLSIAVDSMGNVIITGYFSCTITFGSIALISNGYHDAYVAKLSTTGIWQWAVSAGGSFFDSGHSITTDDTGCCYVVGYYWYSATFGSITLTGTTDLFVAKLDQEGTWQWAVKGGGYTGDSGRSIAVDDYSNIYITGTFSYSASFGSTTLTNSGDLDFFIAKLNSSGLWQWAKKGGGADDDFSFSIAVSSSGDSYIVGEFTGTAQFGYTNLTSIGYSDIFISKLNTSGVWQWATQAGGSFYISPKSIDIDTEGSCLISGVFDTMAVFGSEVVTGGGYLNVFVSKLGVDGTWDWVVQGVGSSDVIASDIAIDANGDCIITGSYSGSLVFGQHSPQGNGGFEGYITKLAVAEMPITVSLIGHVVSNDNPTVGLSDVIVNLVGTEVYWGITDSNGNFSIDDVVSEQTYTYVLQKAGYHSISGLVDVSTGNIDLGFFTMSAALPLSPQNLTITLDFPHLILNWEPVTQNDIGESITVNHYDIYTGSHPYFQCDIESLEASTISNQLTLFGFANFSEKLFFKVIAIK